MIAGGPAPIVAAYLFSVYKTGSSIAIYIGICALIGFVATLFMTEYSHQDISEEYAHVRRQVVPVSGWLSLFRPPGAQGRC